MKFENLYSTTAEKARTQAEEAIAGAQDRVEKASDWVVARKTPVRKLTSAGLKLSAISHRTTDKLLKQQAKNIEGEFDALGRYLDAVAKSKDVRQFVREQASVVPRVTRRAISNSRETIGILREAGSDATELLRGTVSELRGKSVVKKARKAGKKVTKKTKSAAKKTQSAAKKTINNAKTTAKAA